MSNVNYKTGRIVPSVSLFYFKMDDKIKKFKNYIFLNGNLEVSQIGSQMTPTKTTSMASEPGISKKDI